jgi:hypothetical protein
MPKRADGDPLSNRVVNPIRFELKDQQVVRGRFWTQSSMAVNGLRTDGERPASEWTCTRIERRKTYVFKGFLPFSSLETFLIR